MKKIDSESLKQLIKLNEFPILVEDIPNELFENAVILSNDCDVSELNGHYEELEFVPPIWYEVLCEKCREKDTILIINAINNSDLDEQLKFTEILKYRKISTFVLPKNCIIIVTAYNLKERPVAREIYSLTAHV